MIEWKVQKLNDRWLTAKKVEQRWITQKKIDVTMKGSAKQQKLWFRAEP